MDQNLMHIEQGSISVDLSTREGTLRLKVAVESSPLHAGASISLGILEEHVRVMHETLGTYLKSRETAFNVGDIVYEPKYNKRAGEVIRILEDRVTYNAPYRVRFIDQDPRQPDTDYFGADDLVLISRKPD